MKQPELSQLLLDQSKDFFWMIDLDFRLLYANKSYLDFLKEITGVETKPNESVLVEGFRYDYIEKWKTYYNHAFEETGLKIEDHFCHPISNEIKSRQVTFQPLTGDDHKLFAIACQATDITSIVRQKAEANQLMDASLNVFCIINEQGNFEYVSAASLNQWGYSPEELIGKSYRNLILLEDVPKTNEMVAAIMSGEETKSFTNRYKNKDGSITNNIWSVRWEDRTKLLYAVASDGREIIEARKRIETSDIINRTILDSSPDCLKLLELDGGIQYMNYNGLCQMEIDDFSTIKNKNWCTLWGSENEALVKESLAKARNGERVNFTAFCPTAKGTPKWWNVVVAPANKPGEQVQQIISVSRDVTDKIEQEEKILLSEQRFKALVQEGSDLIAILNAAGNYTYVSPTSAFILGMAPEKFMGKNPLEFTHPDDVASALTCLQKLATENTVIMEPIRFKNHKNEWRWIETVLTNMLSNPAVNGIIVNSRDITDKIEQEEKILLSEQRFKALVQEGSDLIAIIDSEGKYRYVSPTSTSILAMAPEEFIGRNITEFIHQEDVEKTLISFQSITTENRLMFEPYRVKNHNDEWRWMETVLTNMLDNPAVKGIVSNSRDITEEKKLKELNGQVGKLAKIGSWEMDLVKRTIFWSDMVHQLHETDPVLFVPNLEDDINFYREDFQQSVKSNIQKCISTGEPFDFEAVLITAKKKELWVRVIGNGESADGDCKRIYGSFQDINGLKESENRLISLSENIPGVIYQYIIHPDGTDSMQYVSGDVENQWGYTTDEVIQNINLLWDNIKFGGDMEEVKTSISKSIQTKSRWTKRFKYVMPNGELKTHLGNGTPCFLADGTIVFNVMVLDITQEAKNEALLSQASQMSRIGSWELDLINQTGDNMYWSPMIKEILEVDDSYNATLTGGIKFYKGENIEKVQQAVNNLIVEGVEVDEEILLITGKGNKRWIRVIGKSETVNNRRTKIYGSLQDIDERKLMSIQLSELNHSLQQHTLELERSNEELEQFAFVVSHDLQEPLRMISSFMDMLQRKYGVLLDEKGHQYIHFATDGAKRMKENINDLLEYSRAGRPTKGKESVNMNEVVFDYNLLRSKLISEKNATIKSHNLPTIKTNKTAITQIINCLIDNSLKYAKAGVSPIVEIDVVDSEKEWVFTIKDNGIGIDPQFFKKIFVLFQRLHNRDEYDGTGIGLSIAKRHIEFLGGQIWLKSAPGDGTVFYFSIPKIK